MARVGNVDTIVSQIVGEAPVTKPKTVGKAWAIVGLMLGAPIWLSLLIAAVAVVLSLYISLWAVVISLWAAEASLWTCALAGIVAGVGFIAGEHAATGIAVIGAGLVCTGVSIFLLWGCKWATRATAWLAKKFTRFVKLCIKKGRIHHA